MKTHPTDDLVRKMTPVRDESLAGFGDRPAARSLLDDVTALPVSHEAPRLRRRVLLTGLPLASAAAVAAVVVAMSVGGPSADVPDATGPRPTSSPDGPAASASPTQLKPGKVQLAALSFSTQGKYLVVKVKDPLADPARYKEQFAEHGMDISLTLVPASPSVVGTVVFSELPDTVKMLPAKGKCFSGGGACPVGVKIPLDFHGSGGIVFGRQARPGETYESTNSAFAPGEILHCVDIRGRTVDQALAVLKGRKVTVGSWHYEEKRADGTYGVTGARGKIPGSWYVSGADPYAPGQIMLWVQQNPPVAGESEAYYQSLTQGCHN
ncbi:hypothetical protein Pth03_62240 [Planotetraspora thailandica]|uniref:Uncharacterized protein n=1 Tax=Planotetraspora thailandica TaxID=487172 RepID=A0A8J3V875_9ACTN|nr:hypothetical protein [Planotetraspora thailandica]GII57835.1 hypothetical protein Pth03_62240 [Planotetraspora thailandica]